MTDEEMVKGYRKSLRQMTDSLYHRQLESIKLKNMATTDLVDMLRERDKRIENLEKGNEELKEKLEHRNCVDCSNHGSNIKLIKAKAIIKNILQTLKNDDFDFTFALKSKHPVLQEAEQFLKEE